ncbi:radical SAM protein [Candidatus Woesearchaeota archaeon]|nr:radical SAM protein [Candidatus Woesearchaeota archaeon]
MDSIVLEAGSAAVIPRVLASHLAAEMQLQLSLRNPPSAQDLRNILVLAYREYKQKDLSIVDVPFCLLPTLEVYMKNDVHPLKAHGPACRSCKYRRKCGGFPQAYTGEVQAVPDAPEEVVIEVTQRCNHDCFFCFNKHCFDDHRHPDVMSTAHVKAIIDDCAKAGVWFLRITGGEPLVRKDTPELLAYAKSKGFLEVRLNSNLNLITPELAKNLQVDNVLVGCNGWNEEQEFAVTRVKGSLAKKRNAVRLLKEAGIPVVRAGTIAYSSNIDHFDEFVELIYGMGFDTWEWYRPIKVAKADDMVTPEQMAYFLGRLYELKQSGRYAPIVNAIPFCVTDPKIASAVCSGGKYDDGQSRIIIGPDGQAKPSYYLDVKLGDGRDIMACWNHPLLQKIRSLEQVDPVCRSCVFLEKCRAGSRFSSFYEHDDYFARDLLMVCTTRTSITRSKVRGM